MQDSNRNSKCISIGIKSYYESFVFQTVYFERLYGYGIYRSRVLNIYTDEQCFRIALNIFKLISKEMQEVFCSELRHGAYWQKILRVQEASLR